MKKLISIFALLIILTPFITDTAYSQDSNCVVIEEATGTWCGYCPCGHQILQTIEASYPNIMILSYHGPVNYGNPVDPFAPYSTSMISLFGFNSFPTAVIGRTSGIVSRSAWLAYVSMQYTQTPGVRIEIINRNYNPTTRTVSGTAKVTALTALSGSYNISQIFTEDHLVSPQNIYAACGTAGIQNDYVHNDVVKGVINGATGTLLFSDCTAGQVFTYPFTYVIPTGASETNSFINTFVFKNTSPYSSAAAVQNAKKVNVLDFVTGINPIGKVVSDYKLGQNYPNPFNPTTNVKFSVPKNTWASFKIYDMLGKEVATYLDHYYLEAGEYNVEIDASHLPSGIYFYKLTTKDFTDVKKMTLLK
jgi:hypothetical protein